jgi:hypothetical protein
MPRVLIDTITGGLYDKTQQAAAFEELPIYHELRSSMTMNRHSSKSRKFRSTSYRSLQPTAAAKFLHARAHSSLPVDMERHLLRKPARQGGPARIVGCHVQVVSWRTRGWTYQEYIASEAVQFYTEDWKPYLGLDTFNHKESPIILSETEQAMNLTRQELATLQPGLYRVSEKLYLASTRQTTREEDIAYSLFGIFNVAPRSYIARVIRQSVASWSIS